MRISTWEDYQRVYKKSIETPEAFWAEIAEDFVWRKKWNNVLEWDFHKPEVKWFIGGKLNITENCLDRHLAKRANQTALIWEPSDPKDEAKKFTYQQMHDHTCRAANMLKANGVKKGDGA